MTKFITYTDGGSRNNPGPAACGIVIKDENEKIILTTSHYLGIATNNQAEYNALYLAIEKVKSMYNPGEKKELVCFLDSELVVKQLNKEYKVKDEEIRKIYEKICKLCSEFDEISFIHIRREKNKLADKLVNEELDKQS